MQDKFTITLTDINGSKHYTLHQIVKKFFLYFLIVLVMALIGGAYFINKLVHEVSYLENKREHLTQEQFDLNLKGKKLKDQIEEKSKEFEMIKEKVASIEELIGITPDENINLDKRLDKITVSSSERKKLFALIPNGNVLPTYKITSPFGWRQHPLKKKREFHPGIDMKAKSGTPIKAPANGVVEFSGRHGRGYGNLIILDHSFGFQTRYGHLKKVKVKNGQFVKKGEVIGYVGSTGFSTGPHLHYEVRFIGRMLNPKNFLKWTKNNFDNIFKKERKVSWQSLINMITGVKKPQKKHPQKQQS